MVRIIDYRGRGVVRSASRGPCGDPRSLASKIIGWYSFEDADGAIRDVSGRNFSTVPNVNGVTKVAGKVGNCGNYVAASVQSHQRNDLPVPFDPLLDWAWWGWVWLETRTANQTVFYMDRTDSSRIVLQVHYNSTGQRFRFTMANFSGNPITVSVGSSNPAQQAWHFLRMDYNSDTSEATCSLNESSSATLSLAFGAYPTDVAPWLIGVGILPAASEPLNGRLDEMGFANARLSAAEAARIYNSGAGVTYTDLLGAP